MHHTFFVILFYILLKVVWFSRAAGLGEKCNSTNECNVTRSYCYQSLCKCRPGYKGSEFMSSCTSVPCFGNSDCQVDGDQHRVCQYQSCMCDIGYGEYFNSELFYCESLKIWNVWYWAGPILAVSVVFSCCLCILHRHSKENRKEFTSNTTIGIMGTENNISGSSINVQGVENITQDIPSS